MKFLFTNKKVDHSLSKDFTNLSYVGIGDYSLLINDRNTITQSGDLSVITNGYLRDASKGELELQKAFAAKHVFNNWPVPEIITGSFSAMIFNKVSSEIVIISDLCNIYPLYYLINKEDIFISNSIILLGRYSKVELDKAGVFQRAVGPNFSNIGSRTILQNCKRLLPGEWIKFNSRGEILQKKYDNSLYSNLGSVTSSKEDLEKYWKHYKREVELCTKGFREVNIALSGGIDSRVALGAIPDDRKITARTFGDPENYESKIAGRLAKIKGGDHSCYFSPSKYFPKKKVLRKHTLSSEAIKLNSWLEILENIDSKEKCPILLGELCEGLPARNIKKFSSSKFRNQNFYKYYLRKGDFNFSPVTSESFNNWKNSKLQQIISWHDKNWFQKLNLTQFEKEIIACTKEDSNEVFYRIKAHNIPYSELFDEIFSWYTFTRMELSRQVNICNEEFYAFSPGMSIQMLRMTSNIHPNDRLYYRFANKLFSHIPELKKFNKVPTSQIPFLPQNTPNLFKIPIWGIRSKLDDYLVKRMMKAKNPNLRYRFLKSINWAKIYQQEDMLENIENYYSNNHLSESYFETFYNLAKRRRELISWPFANMDIISGVSLNTEIDLIKNPPD